MTTPLITIFVRHTPGCKYAGDESAKKCNCRKHLRWTVNGIQGRRSAGTRSWVEAEQVKREVEDELTGREVEKKVRDLRSCVELFIQDKTIQGVALGTVATFTRELERLVVFCERSGVHHIHGVSRDLLTRYAATWPPIYPSSITRSHVRERCRTFLRYCYEAEWLARIPMLPKIRIDEVPTLPLTATEFDRLLRAVPKALSFSNNKMSQAKVQAARAQQRTRALLLLMRWSGLAIRDALCLRRKAITKADGFYIVAAKRVKTGTEVTVPIPSEVAEEILKAPNETPEFLFWSGKSSADNHTTKWQSRFIAPVFKAAGLYDENMHMVSHRLRDTFAVDLLEKGVPMEEVSRLLGHTSIKTTEKHYAKWSKGRQDRVNALVTGTWKKKSMRAA